MKKVDPYFRSPSSKNIKIFELPGTKVIEIFGPPLKYFSPIFLHCLKEGSS